MTDTKTKAAWTNGPWRNSDWTEEMMNGDWRAEVETCQPSVGTLAVITAATEEEVEATANLISAAPDLAEALDMLCRADACNYERDTMRHEGLFEAARAALRKARGEA